jgi:ubiquinone biosynthesis protein UbiJ
MSFALLHSAMLLPLELAINSVLALHAGSRQRMGKLAGNTLAVVVKQPEFTLYLSVDAQKLRLSSRHEGPVTTTLLGSASALAGLLLKREPLTNLQGMELELRGDTGFAQSLQNLLLDLHIDWEYQLSRVLGDVPVQMLATGVHKSQAWLQKTAQRISQDVSNFLQDESGVLPAAAELEAFYSDVQVLVLRLDRLEARLQNLTNHKV